MASPYDIPYLVTENDGSIEFNGECYLPGDTLWLKSSEVGCFRELILPPDNKGCCFPEYCITDGGYAVQGYRVPVELTAGAVVSSVVPTIPGCKPPGSVCFHFCPGGCVYVGYDAEPVVDTGVTDGTFGDPNPTCRDLNEHGECVETIHLYSDIAQVAVLSYYC